VGTFQIPETNVTAFAPLDQRYPAQLGQGSAETCGAQSEGAEDEADAIEVVVGGTVVVGLVEPFELSFAATTMLKLRDAVCVPLRAVMRNSTWCLVFVGFAPMRIVTR